MDVCPGQGGRQATAGRVFVCRRAPCPARRAPHGQQRPQNPPHSGIDGRSAVPSSGNRSLAARTAPARPPPPAGPDRDSGAAATSAAPGPVCKKRLNRAETPALSRRGSERSARSQRQKPPEKSLSMQSAHDGREAGAAAAAIHGRCRAEADAAAANFNPCRHVVRRTAWQVRPRPRSRR